MNTPLRWFALFIGLLSAPAQVFCGQDSFASALVKSRYPLELSDDVFSGAGAGVLRKALVTSQFVLVGEDHGTVQIPQFVSAVCKILGPQGFHTFAVEAGPLAAEQLSSWVSRPDGPQRLRDFERTYSSSIAFFDIADENKLLSDCARAFDPELFHLWGLDQEFLGSSGYILKRILDTNPGPPLRAHAAKLMSEEAAASGRAAKSGHLSDLFMFQVSGADLSTLQELARAEGNAKAQSLAAELMASHEIYKENGSGYAYFRERALLMKSHFVSDYARQRAIEGTEPKVLFKFGMLHLYRGLNPAGSNEIGNYVDELADGQGKQALHICIFAVKGTQLQFGNPRAQFNYTQDEDAGLLYLKPMFQNLESHGWTLFDLRSLRANMTDAASIDPELKRLIFGYDLLVLIPESTAAKPIQ